MHKASISSQEASHNLDTFFEEVHQRSQDSTERQFKEFDKKHVVQLPRDKHITTQITNEIFKPSVSTVFLCRTPISTTIMPWDMLPTRKPGLQKWTFIVVGLILLLSHILQATSNTSSHPLAMGCQGPDTARPRRR